MADRSGAAHRSWLRGFHQPTPGAPRLLCLPHAGGSASFYFPFSKALSPAVDVRAVQYPGRQDRHSEPLLDSVQELAQGVFHALDERDGTPLALFGHSMGAMVGFELARLLEAAGRPPAVFFVSGRRGPSVERTETVHQGDDARLIEEVTKLDGTHAALLQDEEMLRMILPVLRADYRAVETYRHTPGPRLSCPVVALTGDADPRVTPEEARTWSQETDGPFELHVYPGGHFYLVAQQQAVLSRIEATLRRPGPGTGAARPRDPRRNRDAGGTGATGAAPAVRVSREPWRTR
ncbi:thioesterase II family protein [Streptomyces cyanogenus]|uniref:Phenyloxazoline synthase MbtB n=1 Tax=Streptomyces cyanogenus TaxID=80860 RepID=A0ABX7TIV4_STRCY|nr:alpha/beta fold hydrolase [Streptomyces cyanogenus]QTD96527.1 Phenyloxazoline synthase MbtB [Streptomyces cyanogenus]